MAKTEVKQTNTIAAYAGLSRWNRWLAAIFVVQGLAIALLSNPQSFPVQTSYLTGDPIASDIGQRSIVDTATAHLLDFNLVHMVAACFLVAALVHTLLATVYRSSYEADLKKRLNKLRWIEYAVSGGALIAAIALAAGIADASTLLLLVFLTVLSSLSGLAMESYNQGKGEPQWLAYIIGGLAAAGPAIVFAIYTWSTNIYGSAATPGFIYGLYGTLAAAGIGFAVIMRLQYKQVGRWKDYWYTERSYMILSIVAKTALTWQIFAGVLQP